MPPSGSSRQAHHQCYVKSTYVHVQTTRRMPSEGETVTDLAVAASIGHSTWRTAAAACMRGSYLRSPRKGKHPHMPCPAPHQPLPVSLRRARTPAPPSLGRETAPTGSRGPRRRLLPFGAALLFVGSACPLNRRQVSAFHQPSPALAFTNTMTSPHPPNRDGSGLNHRPLPHVTRLLGVHLGLPSPWLDAKTYP